MRKIIIPTILAATILIAGMFAFMPVQKASTVHTTIQSTVGTQFRVALAVAGGLGAAGGDNTVTLTCASACLVQRILVWTTAGDEDADAVSIRNVSFGGVGMSSALLAVTADGALGDLAEGAVNPGTVHEAITSVSARLPADALNISANGFNLLAGGTAVVTIQNNTDADGDRAVMVVFEGVSLATTAPAAPVFA